jgi:putative transposase
MRGFLKYFRSLIKRLQWQDLTHYGMVMEQRYSLSYYERNGIKSKRRPKWKQTTNSKHDLPIAPNLLNQNFDIKIPNTA